MRKELFHNQEHRNHWKIFHFSQTIVNDLTIESVENTVFKMTADI